MVGLGQEAVSQGREPKIPGRLALLNDTLDGCFENITFLRTQLKSVLPMDTAEEAASPKAPDDVVPLVSFLDNLIRKAQAIHAKIKDINVGLEL